jgi:hypothetical protein
MRATPAGQLGGDLRFEAETLLPDADRLDDLLVRKAL